MAGIGATTRGSAAVRFVVGEFCADSVAGGAVVPVRFVAVVVVAFDARVAFDVVWFGVAALGPVTLSTHAGRSGTTTPSIPDSRVALTVRERFLAGDPSRVVRWRRMRPRLSTVIRRLTLPNSSERVVPATRYHVDPFCRKRSTVVLAGPNDPMKYGAVPRWMLYRTCSAVFGRDERDTVPFAYVCFTKTSLPSDHPSTRTAGARGEGPEPFCSVMYRKPRPADAVRTSVVEVERVEPFAPNLVVFARMTNDVPPSTDRWARTSVSGLASPRSESPGANSGTGVGAGSSVGTAIGVTVGVGSPPPNTPLHPARTTSTATATAASERCMCLTRPLGRCILGRSGQRTAAGDRINAPRAEIAAMETLLLDEEAVGANARTEEVIEAVAAAFAAYERGDAQMPAKSYIDLPEYNGDFRSMPAYMDAGEWDAAGIKWVNVHPDNPEKFDLPTVLGTMIYSDPETARPLAIMDGTELTMQRTGAAAAVATDLLAREDARSLGLVGAGVQSYTQVEAIAAVRPIEGIVVSDLDEAAIEAFVDHFGDRFDVRGGSIAEAAACDVLSTVTPSTEPLVSYEDLGEYTHVNAMGADAANKQELDPAILREARVVIDDHAQTTHSGEISIPYADGVIDDDDIDSAVGEIVVGEASGRTPENGITVFDSTGLAIQDVATAHVVYEHARENDNGEPFAFVSQ